MKNSLQNAQRWLKQALHDLENAKRNLKDKFYSDTCFMAEQASQKALKAYLYFKGERAHILIHSLTALVSECSKRDRSFQSLKNAAMRLDKYYILTRYPDALPAPAVPYEEYGPEEAKEAISYAEEILVLAKSRIE